MSAFIIYPKDEAQEKALRSIFDAFGVKYEKDFDETEYLIASEANKKALNRSIQELEAGKGTKVSLDCQFGFKNGDLETIVQTLSKFPEIKKAVIFGSRAKGNHQAGSDVDIAVCTVNDNAIAQLCGILNDETLLPYKFDVLNYDKIDNQELKEQIDRLGVEIYKNQ